MHVLMHMKSAIKDDRAARNECTEFIEHSIVGVSHKPDSVIPMFI